MVHPFFLKVALQPGIANIHASIGSVGHSRANLWFSNVFSIFFAENGVFEEEVESWLNAYSNGFTFNEKNATPQMIQEVKTLFRRLYLRPYRPCNISVFKFWLYLVWMYEKLLYANYNRNDNLFEFMRGFSIEDTRVVFVGNDPAKDVNSSGYAFHLSQSSSTRQILDLVGSEMLKVSNYSDEYSWAISSKELYGAKRNCNLGGWIQQGVLLLNSSLTYIDDDGTIYQAWQILTDYIIRYISENVGDVVFLFLGGAQYKKKNFVNLSNNNFVMDLYHPARYTYLPPRPVKSGLDWKTRLPFLNANFYLYQLNRDDDMIDWKSIGWPRAGRKGRLRRLCEFFDHVTSAASCVYPEFDRFRLANMFFVNRDENNILSLELVTQ